MIKEGQAFLINSMIKKSDFLRYDKVIKHMFLSLKLLPKE
jgi:hypothetical protein